MTTTTAALALRQQADVLAGSISSLFARCSDNADDTAQARIIATIGRVDALRFTRTQDAFDTAFEMLTTRRFFLEFVKLVSDEAVLRFVRSAMACEIAGHAPKARNAQAAELGDDLAQRFELLVKLLTHNPAAERAHEAYEALAGWIAAVTGIRLASFAPEQWPEWAPGVMWNLGRRALVDIARAAAIPWEVAIDALTTARDASLLKQPFDEAASDQAARLLGLQ